MQLSNSITDPSPEFLTTPSDLSITNSHDPPTTMASLGTLTCQASAMPCSSSLALNLHSFFDGNTTSFNRGHTLNQSRHNLSSSDILFAFVPLPLLEVAAEPDELCPVYAEYEPELAEKEVVDGPGLELREAEVLLEEKPATEAVGERSSLDSSGKNERTVVSAVRRRYVVNIKLYGSKRTKSLQ